MKPAPSFLMVLLVLSACGKKEDVPPLDPASAASGAPADSAVQPLASAAPPPEPSAREEHRGHDGEHRAGEHREGRHAEGDHKPPE